MTASWFEIFVIAFTAQLAVLPGEKVQLIIAGLSTKYNPLIVVSAAGTAFAGWTAVEIVVGEALTRLLPGTVLNGFTAAMLALFAVLLYRSMPDKDDEGNIETVEGGPQVSVPFVNRDVPDVLGGFLPIFAMMAVGEFGDKTQLITITLAANYGATSAIWFGEMAAIIPVSLVNALFFYRFSHTFDLRKAHIFGAVVFAFFALDTVLSMATGFSVWETVVGFVSGAVGGAF
ncbi:TMEM165/GDT1 family protein [Haladaptatus sp. F3-133]|jgi:putative Ca2+/H+ antiporter (TMEM165/GDT1 family)|uniref:TMEM165/GDT1 family protein n=1 Tax=Halorutilus salinus TaxID=2487751 RepID=A0A9Q4C4Y5_9EURY|nr:TMEM165/GDT1 family protein [Halorutilus salinus]MCX2819266.1 TMEM165/GDT1 family protein [Halorutilus salinus]